MLILVAGLPGTGKTTFARALASAIDAQHLNSDIVRHQLGKRGQYDPDSKKEVYQALHTQTEVLLSKGTHVVLDATFYKKSLRQSVLALAEKYALPSKWIEIKASEAIIKKRINKKRAYSEADFEVFLKIKAIYEPLDIKKLVLWSDKDTVEEMVFKSIAYLNLK